LSDAVQRQLPEEAKRSEALAPLATYLRLLSPPMRDTPGGKVLAKLRARNNKAQVMVFHKR